MGLKRKPMLFRYSKYGIVSRVIGLYRSSTPSHSRFVGFGKLNKSPESTHEHSLLIIILWNYRLFLINTPHLWDPSVVVWECCAVIIILFTVSLSSSSRVLLSAWVSCIVHWDSLMFVVCVFWLFLIVFPLSVWVCFIIPCRKWHLLWHIWMWQHWGLPY